MGGLWPLRASGGLFHVYCPHAVCAGGQEVLYLQAGLSQCVCDQGEFESVCGSPANGGGE